jgi:hypothetical protein
MRKEFKALTVAERELKRGESERASGQRDYRVDVMDRGRRTGGRLGKANGGQLETEQSKHKFKSFDEEKGSRDC